MSAEPTLRPFVPADAAGCLALLETVLPNFGLKVDYEGPDKEVTDIPRYYEGGGFWVISGADARLLGMGGLKRSGPETAQVRKMYFLPELRGRGYGRKMLDTQVAFARANGIRLLTLETVAAMETAIRLYEKYGFVQDPSLLKTPRCNRAYRLDL